jgi:hypothetical protein
MMPNATVSKKTQGEGASRGGVSSVDIVDLAKSGSSLLSSEILHRQSVHLIRTR